MVPAANTLGLQQVFLNSLTGVTLNVTAVVSCIKFTCLSCFQSRHEFLLKFQDEYITKQLNMEFLKYLQLFLNFT